MVYTSLPLYLDPPNWNQQQSQQQQQQQPLLNSHVVAGDANSSRQIQQPSPPQPSLLSTARPNSMSERARLAKIPQPEQALKCPRCDSTNTKFCYFNNYSLSQPRHFCKTCRRYWTRGGALRNVPVGGGCRRNKRIKTASKSTSSATDAKAGPSGGSGAIGATSLTTPLPQLPFLQSFNSLADYGSSTNLGLNYCGIPTVEPVEYPAVSSSSGYALEPWRFSQQVQLQHLPFFAGMEPHAVMQQPTSMDFYPLNAQAPVETAPAGLAAKPQHVPPVNIETKHVGVHVSDGHWRDGGGAAAVSGGGSITSEGGGAGNGWSELSGFNSTSTGVLL